MGDDGAMGIAQRALRPQLKPADLRIAALGHSFVANMVQGTATSPVISDRSHLYWATVLSNQRLSFDWALANGLNGDTIAGVLSRTPATIATGAKTVLLDVGTNDLASSVSLADMKASYTAILDLLTAARCVVICMPIVPRFGTSWGAASTAQIAQYRARAAAFNTWLFGAAGLRPNVYPVDLLDLWTDFTIDYDILPPGGTSAGVGSYTFDGLHPSFLGAFIAGMRIAETINRIAPAQPRMWSPTTVFDAALNPNGNLLVNPMMLGTTGFVGTGTTGVVAGGWAVARNQGSAVTGVSSVATTALANGKTMSTNQIVVSNGGTVPEAMRLFQQVNISGRYAPGATLHGSIDMQVDAGSSFTGARFSVAERDATGGNGNVLATATSGGVGDTSATASAYSGPAWAGRLRTPKLIAQPNALSVTYSVDIFVAPGGTATVRLGNASFATDGT
jgi:lysophospholipase L1-like esterase